MAVVMAGSLADYLVEQMALKKAAQSVSHSAETRVAKMAAMTAVLLDWRWVVRRAAAMAGT